MPATQAETDPSVCYRHPDRSSWTLCTRCGRTICPECQILTPEGVRCPDCVRETGGSVRWEPTSGARSARTKKVGMRRSRSSVLAGRVRASSYPVVTIATAAIALVLWLAGFATGNAPYNALAAFPDVAWQVWRYVTASIAYSSSLFGIVFTLLSIAIFVFIGWGAERQFGRNRHLLLVIVSGAGATAISMVAGAGASGLTGPIWGIAGAYLILVWPHPAARNRLLVSIVIWLIISLFLGGNILALIGGALSGIGATLLLRRYDDLPRSRPGTPYLIIGGVLAILIILAILRSLALG
ncbi:MAG: rhomboid family intramembrane serine protease [Pseudolysinimonas sp.]